jgi:hypothetical protein
MTIDRDVLASVFAARVQLAKKSLEQVLLESTDEWNRTRTWLASQSRKEGSFLDMCDEFDLDPGAVRKAVLKAQREQA